MIVFTYTIRDKVGLHARPAGRLAQAAKAFQSTVTVHKGDKSADTGRLMALMGLGIHCGDEVMFEIKGPDEEAAAKAIQQFLTEQAL